MRYARACTFVGKRRVLKGEQLQGNSCFLGVKVFASPRGSIRLGQLVPFSFTLTFFMPLHLQPEFYVIHFIYRGLHHLLNAKRLYLCTYRPHICSIVDVFEEE